MDGQTYNTTACLFDGDDMHLFSLENIEGKCIPDFKELSHIVNFQSFIPEDIWNLPATNVELSKAVPPLLVKICKPIIFVYLALPKSGTEHSWAELQLLCNFYFFWHQFSSKQEVAHSIGHTGYHARNVLCKQKWHKQAQI